MKVIAATQAYGGLGFFLRINIFQASPKLILITHAFFCKNIFYKNHEAQILEYLEWGGGTPTHVNN